MLYYELFDEMPMQSESPYLLFHLAAGVRVLIRQELGHTSSLKWKAVELALGLKFSRDKCDVKLVDTSLMHRWFLRRNRGTFGPAIKAGDAIFPTADDGSCGRRRPQ